MVQYSTCILASLGLDETHHAQLLEAGVATVPHQGERAAEED